MRGERCVLAGIFSLLIAGYLRETSPRPRPLSRCWVDTAGRLLHVELSPDEKWRLSPSPEAIARIRPFLLAKEDKYFFYHPGVYPPALVRAVWHTLHGKRQGGSTLTMQLVRLWRPGPRTPLQKIKEILWAIGIELRYRKSDILRFYLTYAPFGGNIEGIEAASLYYFGKRAERLTPKEIAALLLLSQRPSLVQAFLTGSAEFEACVMAWLSRWHEQGLLTLDELHQAKETPLLPNRYAFPRLPPNLLSTLVRLTSQNRPTFKAACEDGAADTLYLSLPLQRYCTRLLREHLAYWRSCGIEEGAILVADIRSGAILTYVPSDFYEHCAIDLLQVRRSVGSTLKPFLWALALEKGLIHSETPLLDMPRLYRGYVPVNFERGYAGRVLAMKALQESLNAPAVELLEKVGAYPFLRRLEILDLKGLPSHPAVIVGSGETTVYCIVQAYTALGPDAQWRKLRWGPHDPLGIKAVGDSAAAWIVRRGLRRADGWSYKTGTSARLRDAWCIAWDERFVIGVWLGNPNGSPSGCLRGSLSALPLAEAIARYLGPGILSPPPLTVEKLSACGATGMRSSPDCETRVEALAVQGKFSQSLCNHWRSLWYDERYSYCDKCMDFGGDRLREVRLPALPWVLLARSQPLLQKLPPHFPSCTAVEIECFSPQEGHRYWLPRQGAPIFLWGEAAPTAPLLWGIGQDTIGWQKPGTPLPYPIHYTQGRLRLWVQVGRLRKETWCEVKTFP